MTAEIVVMNRDGVAMAADSAVTIGDGPKILNTANKVFMLAPGYPVGILVYSNATFMGVPWEIIIKYYRDDVIKNNKLLPTLEDYATGFFNFIANNGNKFVTNEQETGFFEASVRDGFTQILRKIWAGIKHEFYTKAEISSAEIESIIKYVIAEYENYLGKVDNIFPDEESEKYRAGLLGVFGKNLDQLIEVMFEKFPINADNAEKLKQIALLRIIKVPNMYSMNNLSGIVFAGYGEDDLYPRCIENYVYGYYCKTLVFAQQEYIKVGFSTGETASALMPFAQRDIAENLLDGKHPKYKRELITKLNGKFKIEEVMPILEEVDKAMWQQYTQSIINTIGILTKDELATVARTLVTLTSFMRKVSSDMETVGGPVDVAVISKKDGFVWIDRKHYFEIEKNLHFRSK